MICLQLAERCTTIEKIRPDRTSEDAARNHQWVELWNRSEGAVDVAGWRLSNQAGRESDSSRELPPVAIPPGGYLVVHISQGENQPEFGETGAEYFTHDPADTNLWDPDAGAIALYSPAAIVDFFAWATLSKPLDAGEAGRAGSVVSQPGALNWRVYSHLLQGNHAPAVSLMASTGLEYYSPDPPALFRQKGMSGVARHVLAATERSLPVSAYRRAHWRMVLGDKQGALEELETAHEARGFDLMYAAVDPMFEPLRDEPRFRKIASEMKLPIR